MDGFNPAELNIGDEVAWFTSNHRGRTLFLGYVMGLTRYSVIVMMTSFARTTKGSIPAAETRFEFDRETGNALDGKSRLLSPLDGDVLSMRYRALAKPAIRRLRQTVHNYKGFRGAEDALAELDSVAESVDAARSAIRALLTERITTREPK